MQNPFFKTGAAGSGVPKKHYHLIYMHPQQGPIVTTSAGHTHAVIQNEDGSFSLEPDPVDGHAHEGMEALAAKPEKKEDDEDVVAEVLSVQKQLYELEAEAIEDGREADEFYMGNQWEEKTRQALESSGRACLTINMTEKHIDDLCGIQRQQRTDMRALPVEGGDQRVCDILNILIKNALEQCFFEREESKVFFNQSVPGRGVFDLRYDYSRDIEGRVEIDSFPWDQVHYGPHLQEDLSDCEVMTKFKMVSLTKLKQLYPKKAEQIGECYKECSVSQTTGSTDDVQYGVDHYGKGKSSYIPKWTGDSQTVDITRKEMALIEMHRRVYKRGYVVTDVAANVYWNAFGVAEKDLKQLETIPGLQLVETDSQKIRITRVCGKVLLSDENPADLPADDFFTIPVYGKRMKGRFWGKVKSAMDPQREINKRTSQSIDIVNRMASYGWFYDQGTFTSKAEIAKFEENAAVPGFTQMIADSNRPPQKVEGVKFPGEIVNLSQLAIDTHASLISVSVDHAGANTSGQAFAAAEQQRMKGSEYLFDNLSFAKKLLGRRLLAVFQKYYTPERIWRIVANENAKMMASNPPPAPAPGAPPGAPPQEGAPAPAPNELQIGGQPFSTFDKEEIILLLEDKDLTDHDIVIGESSWSPTERMANLVVMTEMVGKGVPIPPEILMQFMDLPDDLKQKMIQGVVQQQQSQAAAEQSKSDSEVEKTIISTTGQIPPKVLERMGMQPPAAAPAPEQVPMQQPAPSNVTGIGGAI